MSWLLAEKRQNRPIFKPKQVESKRPIHIIEPIISTMLAAAHNFHLQQIIQECQRQ